MLARELLVIIAWLWIVTVHSYTSSSSISTCITYESDTSKKWWRYSTTTSSGYACSSTETSSVWGGSSSYRWSSDSSSYLPQNSKKLLCPTDYSNCNKEL